MMSYSLSFMRTFVLAISIVLATSFAVSTTGLHFTSFLLGIGSGAVFGLLLIGAEALLKNCSLRSFNLMILALFLGYIMGQALILILDAALDPAVLSSSSIRLFHAAIILSTTYAALFLLQRSNDQLALCIPFVKLKTDAAKRKQILLDSSILSDPRIIDLAASGLVDQLLVLPRFVLKEFHDQVEHTDDTIRNKARRGVDVVKKLEALPELELTYTDTDFSEIKDLMARMVRLARFCDAHLLTADINRVQQSGIEGVRIINIHALSNALKPLMQTGEILDIKIQRYGKEAKQGVGYLEDGTMVVVNGGGDFIGDVIKSQVLSVKHTSSGRMIFCNALSETLKQDFVPSPDIKKEFTASSHRDYFLV